MNRLDRIESRLSEIERVLGISEPEPSISERFQELIAKSRPPAIVGPGNPEASAAEPSPSPDAECADRTASTVTASPAPVPSGPDHSLANSDDAAPSILPDIPAALDRRAAAE